MTSPKKSDESDEYITTTIHKDFYFNKSIGLSTIIEQYEKIEESFDLQQYLACISIHIERLNKIESLFGSQVYNQIISQIVGILGQVKKDAFRNDDIFVVDLIGVDVYLIFLSAPREKDTQLLDHLESIAERVRVHMEQDVFRIVYPYLKEFTRPNIGYAMAIQNPMINNIRLIMQLVHNAKKMGEFQAEKQSYLSKFTLQKIIVEKKIYTVFQPIVNLDTLEVIGYEALSREPKHTEFASPQLLFTLAAEYGLSFELDRLCRKKAFASVRKLGADKKFFLNTLTMTIHDPEFRGAYLTELLEDLKIKPENVVFEISERLAVDNYDLFRNAMRDYTDIGIIHASDDIGSGHSDLERIMELNPGFMKIDISFVRGIEKNYIKQQIVRAIVSLAQNINSTVIAEGIETKEEFNALKELQVHFGQGFLFAKPSQELHDIRTDF